MNVIISGGDGPTFGKCWLISYFALVFRRLARDWGFQRQFVR